MRGFYFCFLWSFGVFSFRMWLLCGVEAEDEVVSVFCLGVFLGGVDLGFVRVL